MQSFRWSLYGKKIVCIDKSFYYRIIIPVSQIIHFCFIVIIITLIAEWICLTDGIFLASCDAQNFSPAVIFILCHNFSGSIGKCNNIILKILYIKEFFSVCTYGNQICCRIIFIPDNFIPACFCYKKISCHTIVRSYSVYRFSYSIPCMVITITDLLSVVNSCQHSPLIPGKYSCSFFQHVSHGIIFHFRSIPFQKLISPYTVKSSCS